MLMLVHFDVGAIRINFEMGYMCNSAERHHAGATA